MNFKSAEEILDSACLEMMSRGWTITPGLTVCYSEKRCCPLAAIELSSYSELFLSAVKGEVFIDLSAVETQYEIVGFRAGFDNYDYGAQGFGYNLGTYYRMKYGKSINTG